MAGYGLLAGFGRGLSQGAELLNRGMAEDREVERQRLREESMNARWKRQEEREDARYSDEKKYRDERIKVEDKRYNDQKAAQSAATTQAQNNADRSYNLQERQMTSQEEARRVQRIEETLGRIQTKFSREGEQIDRKYDRLIDQAAPEDKQALYEQRDREHAALGSKLEGEMLPALKSFGDGLKGTSYASYIDVLAEMNRQKTGPEPLSQQTEPAAFNRGAAVGTVLQQPGGQASPVNAAGATTTPGLLNPGFFNGFKDSAHGDINPLQIDETNITPAQLATTRTGQALGYFPGKFVDAVQQVGQVAQPAWNYLNNPMNQGRK